MEDFTPTDEPVQDVIEDSSPSEENDTEPTDSAEDANAEDSSTPEPDAEGDADTDEGAAPSKGAEKRIKQLSAKLREAEREAAYLRGVAEGKKPEEKAPEPEVQPTLTAKPNRDDFEDYDEYVEALTDYKLEQRQAEATRKAQAETEAARAAEKEANWSKQVSEVAKSRPDFHEVVTSNRALPINKVMADAIKESEHGAEVAYWLGKNPEQASRIAGLTPFAAVREIGRIEERLTSSKSAPTEPKRITGASEPITPLAGKSGGAKDPDKMTDAEWYANYKAEQAQKRAR